MSLANLNGVGPSPPVEGVASIPHCSPPNPGRAARLRRARNRSLRGSVLGPLTGPVANRDRHIACRLRRPCRTIGRTLASRRGTIHTDSVSLHLSDRPSYIAVSEPDQSSETDHGANQDCYRHLNHDDGHTSASPAITSARKSRCSKNAPCSFSGCRKSAAPKARTSNRRARTI